MVNEIHHYFAFGPPRPFFGMRIGFGIKTNGFYLIWFLVHPLCQGGWRNVPCGICRESCQMDAISPGYAAMIDPDRCIGCGLCVASCDFGAAFLERKEDRTAWIPPLTIAEAYSRIVRERGR